MSKTVREYYRELGDVESLALLHEKLDWLAQALHFTFREIDDSLLVRNRGGVKKRLHIWPYPFPNLIPGHNLPNLQGNSTLDRDTMLWPGRDTPFGTDPHPID